jgi:predicted  nucleic acid-binding Zn-ribbon protein
MVISSVKDMMEGELASANLQKELVCKDFSSLSERYEALKGAYNSLEGEAEAARRTNREKESAEDSNSKGSTMILQSQLDAAKEKIVQLQTELFSITRRNIELEKMPNSVHFFFFLLIYFLFILGNYL